MIKVRERERERERERDRGIDHHTLSSMINIIGNIVHDKGKREREREREREIGKR